MTEIRAESRTHLQELLYEESWKPDLGCFRSDLVFRGLQDHRSDLSSRRSSSGRPGTSSTRRT